MVKLMKRLCCVALVLLMLPALALAGSMVVDDEGLFTYDEIREMEDIIRRIRSEYQMDVVILTSSDAGYNDSQDFADLYFERNGYGLGDDDAGLLYLIDMYNRVPCISTSGVMIDYITDSRLEELFDCSYDDLARGEYGQSTLKLLRRLESFLAEGRQEGSFRYDAETGRRLSGLYNTLTGGEVLVAAAVALVVAVIMWASVNGSYNMKGGSFRIENAGQSSVELTRDEDEFIRQNVIRTRNAPPPSSGGSGGSSGRGSSVHRSSSGGTHGGGVGRKF